MLGPSARAQFDVRSKRVISDLLARRKGALMSPPASFSWLPSKSRLCLGCRNERDTLKKKIKACKDEKLMLEAKTEELKDR
jgi:hypothetical protein